MLSGKKEMTCMQNSQSSTKCFNLVINACSAAFYGREDSGNRSLAKNVCHFIKYSVV